MGCIGNIVANLAVDSSKWNKGLNSATSSMDKMTSAQRKMFNEGARVTEQFMTPLEKVEKEIGKVSKLYEEGAISATTYNRAMAKLEGQLPRVETGLEKVQRKLKGMKTRATSALRSIGTAAKFTAAGMALLGTAKVIGGIRESVGKMQDLAKASRQTGESVEKLSALSFAANKFNIGTDQIISATEELNIRLGETIRDGTGPAAEAFQTLGLNAQELANMMPTERFKAVADEIANIQDVSKRGFLTDEIFGGSGFELLPLLREGSDGIQKLMDEADQLGATFNAVDAAKLEAANGTVARMSAGFQGITNKITIAMAPAVEAIGETIVSSFKSGVDATGGMEIAMKGLVRVAGFVADAFYSWKPVWAGLQAGVTTVVAKSVEALEWLAKSVESIINQIPGVEVSFTGTLSEVSKALDDLKKDHQDAFGKVLDAELPSTKLMKQYEQAIAKAEDSVKNSLAPTIEDSFATALQNPLPDLWDQLQNGMSAAGEWLQSAVGNFEPKSKQTEQGEGPRSLAKNSAEFFRAINTEQGRPKGMEQKQDKTNGLLETTNSLLEEMVNSRTAAPVLKALGLT